MENEHISYEDFNTICRFCLKSDLALKPIFKTEPHALDEEKGTLQQEHQESEEDDCQQNNILEMISSCIGLTINTSDGLPKTLCTKCFDIIFEMDKFKKECLSSDNKLNRIKLTYEQSSINIKNALTMITKIKYEKKELSENVDTTSSKASSMIPNDSDKNQTNEHQIDKINNSTSSVIDRGNCEQKTKKSKGVKQKQSPNKRKPQKPKEICPICGVMALSLKPHLLTHSDLKPHACSICGECFKRNHSLKIHMNKHTGERPYKCSECNQTFISTHNLRSHMRTHSNERKFTCHLCDKSYRHKTGLVYHLRKHSNDRRYKCTECSKMFLCGNVLRKHYLTHTGIRAFKCETCQKAFQTKFNLAVHQRVHNRINNEITAAPTTTSANIKQMEIKS